MTSRFYNPVETRFGWGSLLELADITEHQTVALVTFPEARGLGLVQRIEDLLGDRLVYVIEDVQPNPDVAQLRGTYERFWREAGDCQVVVAVGGGSAIDTAKALIVGTESGTFDELLALLSTGQPFAPARSKILVAAPTTAGTGSEVTPWATIWDSLSQKKYSLHLECTWPKVAIVDPQLMLTVPASVTVSTGLDALSHALESIWNINGNAVSDTFAVAAIEDILECLPLLRNDLSNPQLRTRMALAALKAGLAFSNTKTALAHSISYEMTLRHGLPHGIACSFTLPLVLGLAWGHDEARDRTLQRIFGTDMQHAQRQLREFLHNLGVKTEFTDYGVNAGEAQEMVRIAMQGARGKNFIGSRAA
ncbi:iron-containing alcohol dehydrogenase PsrA [Pseudomonas psychrophila]|jgi:phosphonate metabolism-associated iron-containing alcohol dehydrogenase|uniref:Iron-containing alcohol dehydrogenase n=1 Tax=Pseudomonas psychrophila TaxID=122355 RepID=A0A8I1FR44_9PSED|nr:iron-containing alcohol dehydrogenase PsrA [Pseudomonas psychrophila]EPJ92824.1 phosphonate metabolism-associated iron-containing alcohol dehydrogenase [Pseudomonas psychrophila]KAB0492301.1 iron-containing alcohol dehydrogenase [Pseudomonas psychrophila]KMM99474.1 alcohol dehydrogenase [Pseudomonas psychrophila]KOX62682.1 alcohol dehydrogenase [Pseudomonas psychrophila]MBJ2256270.1 iron-containing alcohol dehydrogenase [Pseudomonas psychrophila]